VAGPAAKEFVLFVTIAGEDTIGPRRDATPAVTPWATLPQTREASFRHAALMTPRLLIATRNKGKLAEFARLLGSIPVELVDLGSAGVKLEVEETGATYAENAAIKAKSYSHAAGLPTLADDSGIEVAALGGGPGPQSARFGGPGLTDRDRVELLLKRLADVPGWKRSARFVAALALAGPGVPGGLIMVEGVVEGAVTHGPAGENGFGYDPVFWLNEEARTMAELSPQEKDRISHRGRAVRAMLPHLHRLAAQPAGGRG
jgi:XTP/dITP diphosphohydrolase